MILSNRLPVLAAQINDALNDMNKSAELAAQRALDAGAALIEAKREVPHGRWGNWLRQHCELSERSAQRYMSMVRAGLNSATVADLGIKGAVTGRSKRPARRDPAEALATTLLFGASRRELPQLIDRLMESDEPGAGVAVLLHLWHAIDDDAAKSKFLDYVADQLGAGGRCILVALAGANGGTLSRAPDGCGHSSACTVCRAHRQSVATA